MRVAIVMTMIGRCILEATTAFKEPVLPSMSVALRNGRQAGPVDDRSEPGRSAVWRVSEMQRNGMTIATSWCRNGCAGASFVSHSS